jgi:uncharacterized protein (DUF362 family)
MVDKKDKIGLGLPASCPDCLMFRPVAQQGTRYFRALVVAFVGVIGMPLAACRHDDVDERSTGQGGSAASGGATASIGASGSGGNAAASGGAAGAGAGSSPAAIGGAGGRGDGGAAWAGGRSVTGGSLTRGTGGAQSGGGNDAAASGGVQGLGGATASGGAGGSGGSVSAQSVPSGDIVAIVQSSKAQATDITQDEIRAMVADAVAQAGGLGFLKAGQTVVVKPNLLVSTSDGFRTLLPVTTNGITADWRVTKAVTELVRERIGSSGKLLIMEGSTESTTQAFSRLGYTTANFGTDVDEFIPLEGSSCSDRSTNGLVQKTAASGKSYWMNERYAKADAVISVAVMKTHFQAGVTGGVKNLGIGATPASQYAKSGCGRDQQTLLPHTLTPLSSFIADYYSLKPASFVVMDGLQGIQHGPLPAWGGGNYNNDRMNMRLILASSRAVALDTVEATVMGCDAKKVPHLANLEAAGYGTTDLGKITVVGKSIAEVRKSFAGPAFACPGN